MFTFSPRSHTHSRWRSVCVVIRAAYPASQTHNITFTVSHTHLTSQKSFNDVQNKYNNTEQIDMLVTPSVALHMNSTHLWLSRVQTWVFVHLCEQHIRHLPLVSFSLKQPDSGGSLHCMMNAWRSDTGSPSNCWCCDNNQ